MEKGDVLLVIDMQVALFDGSAKFDADGLVCRMNRLAREVRESGGRVIFVRHSLGGADLHAGDRGWHLLPGLEVEKDDAAILKTTCDCFAGTGLSNLISPSDARLIVTGFATEFCVDTTVRSAALRGYDVWAPADGHTTADRPHLSAQQVIAHHNYIWSNFIGAGGSIDTAPMVELQYGAASLPAGFGHQRKASG